MRAVRTVELDPTLIGALPPEGHARQWRTLLFSANLMVELPAQKPGECPPIQTIRAIQQSFATLPGLQDDVTAVAHRLGWELGEVPNGVWGGIAAFGVVLLWLTNSMLVTMLGAPILLAPFAVVGLLTFAMLEVNRRKLLEQREHDLLENRGEIAGLVVALLRRDWVCRLDETVVLYNAPSVHWLRNRVEENKMQPLEAWLRDQHMAAKARIDAAVAAGPEFEALDFDLEPVRARLEEAGKSIRLQPEVDAALSSDEP